MWTHATNIPSLVPERFFSETGAGKHVPRCVMVDLEPTESCMCSVVFLLLNHALSTSNPLHWLLKSSWRFNVATGDDAVAL